MTTAAVRTTREREGEGERRGDHGDDNTKQARGEKGGRDDATPSLTSSCLWGGQQCRGQRQWDNRDEDDDNDGWGHDETTG
jgi:hypothetical protein